MSMLEYKNKFQPENTRKKETWNEDQFFNWTSNHFYRTSYHDMSSRSPVERNNNVSPGYKGFIPGRKSDNETVGMRFTEETRSNLRRDRLDDKLNLIATTGFNISKLPKTDANLDAWTHKHGKGTILSTSPNLAPYKQFRSNSQFSFASPKKLPRPTWRARNVEDMFDKESRTQVKDKMNGSGFGNSFNLFDGTGWVPEKNLHGDMTRTLYRNQFNKPKPFHQSEVRGAKPVIKKKEFVYEKDY